MSDSTSPITADASAQDRTRKRKALLAGGLVLGLGAAATLAAFSDDVFSSGSFNTGDFNIQGSANGTDYDEYSTAGDAADLTFELDALQMSPGQTVYAPFDIRIDADSTLDGTITHNFVEADGTLAGLLTYSMASDSENCSVDTPPDEYDWGTGVSVNGPTEGATGVGLTAGADTAAGTPIQVCIAVTLDSDQAAVNAADKTNPTTVTWGWNAQSVDA